MKANLSGLLLASNLFIVMHGATGCAHHGSGTNQPGATPDTSLTGNWQFQTTSSGSLPFTSLSGFVNEQQIVGDATFTTASLQVQSDRCFSRTKVIDFDGFTNAPLAQLTSFVSQSQTITLGLSQQCTGVSLCGTYTIVGGCADQAVGTIVGTKYSRLQGTYKTDGTEPTGLQMSISQSDQGSGLGSFQVSGSIVFTGIVCATSAVVDPTLSFVSGSSLHLVSTIGGLASPPLIIDATIDPKASTLTIVTVTFVGSSSCFVPLVGASLSNV